jgi:hypothetical protein
MSTSLIPVSSVFLLGLRAIYFRPIVCTECHPTYRQCFIPQNYSLDFCFSYFTCHPCITLIIRVYGLFSGFSFVLTVCSLSFIFLFRHRVPSPPMFHLCRMRPLLSRYLVFSFTCALASVIVCSLTKPRFQTEKASYTIPVSFIESVPHKVCQTSGYHTSHFRKNSYIHICSITYLYISTSIFMFQDFVRCCTTTVNHCFH